MNGHGKKPKEISSWTGNLAGGFNPIEKMSQNGNRGENKKYVKPPPKLCTNETAITLNPIRVILVSLGRLLDFQVQSIFVSL